MLSGRGKPTCYAELNDWFRLGADIRDELEEGKLTNVSPQKRRSDDIAIEHYKVEGTPLAIVTREAALRAYPGPQDEAEAALVAIFEWTNKGIAHLTSGVMSGSYTDRHLDIACRGIPVLLHNTLYAKLGREIPSPPPATLRQ